MNLNNPNAYSAGSDSERIELALDYALKNSLPLEITARQADDGRNFWLLDRAILLPENSELRLIDCKLKLSDRCRDNFIRSANCGLGIDPIRPLSGIRVIGVGNAVLEGADHPRATGDSGKTIGEQSYGTDSQVASESQKGDWRNIGILLAEVSDFVLENLCIINSHCWAISLEFCKYGTVKDIRFFSTGTIYIDGKPRVVLNQDGLDLRRGCRHIQIENISGNTGDDLVALTAIAYPGMPERPAGSLASSMVSATALRGEEDDVFDISIRHVYGYSAGICQIVRFLNSCGIRMHDILLEDLEDCSPAYLRDNTAVKIGDSNPRWGGVTPLGDTYNFTVRNVFSNSVSAVLIAGSLKDSTISGIKLRSPGLKEVAISSGEEYLVNVNINKE
ncbi:MAG: hypothetical protein J6W81_00995 [Lentisphaeria bacterium]|nr:hypothetical protein [Lentisphaeria bacterium]